MSTNSPENQESEDLILSFLNQDCFDEADEFLPDPKLLPNEDNLWDFLNNVPSINKENLLGGVSPPWSSSSSDDNGGIHESSSPRSSKADLPNFTSPKSEVTDTEYWQFVNEECVLDTATPNPNTSLPAGPAVPLDLPILPGQFSQGISTPLFYPPGLASLPAYPGLPLLPTIPVMPIIQTASTPPKKKRGRKKREPCPAPSTANLVPLKPLIPVNSQPATPLNYNEVVPDLPSNNNDPVYIKKEATEPSLAPTSAITHNQAAPPKAKHSPVPVPPSTNTPSVEAATLALNKRQERLIKNRAAALLSRKRKREHMANLETTNEALQQENDELKAKVEELGQEIQTISRERDQAKEECVKLRKLLEELGTAKEPCPLEEPSNDTSIAIEHMDVDLEGNYIRESERNEIIKLGDKRLSKPKTTGVVLMIIFFSFALFSLPMTNYQSTIGSSYGSRAVMSTSLFTPNPHVESSSARIIDVGSTPKVGHKPSKRSLPIADDDLKCHLNYTQIPRDTSGEEAQLPRSASGEEATQAMYSWLRRGKDVDKQKVKPAKVENQEEVSMAVTTFRKPQPNVLPLFDHAYLYAADLQHFFTKQNKTNRKMLNQRPRISLLSPVGGVFPPPWVAGPSDRKYLKIDVEVTGSGFVDTGDSWMFPGLKRAPVYGGTIDA